MVKKKRTKKISKKGHNWPRTLAQVGSVASSAFNIASTVAAMVNSEDKYKDTDFNGSLSDTSPLQAIQNRITQGSDNTERVGRQIRLTAFHYRAVLTMNTAATTQQLAVYVVVDKKHNGSLFTMSDYLTANNEISFRNIDNHSRFHTIYRKCFNFSINGGNRSKCIDIYLDLKKIGKLAYTEYKGITSSIADISGYPLYVVYVSSASNTQPIDVRSRGRVKYIDN